MRNGIPSIKHVMTSFPYWVASDATVDQALQLMQERGIHHLPIKKENELVGVITRKDLEKFLYYREGEEQLAKQHAISDLFIKNPYIVDIDEPLDNVLVHMANNHIGSVLVTRSGRLAGVFTTNDACRTFGEYLRDRFRPSPGDDVA